MVSSVTSPVRRGSHKDCGFGVRYTNFMFINKRLAEGLFSYRDVLQCSTGMQSALYPATENYFKLQVIRSARGHVRLVRTRRVPRFGLMGFSKS
jgi:hypothetical protein